MSSTEADALGPELARVFREVLVPLAEALRASGWRAFPPGPEAGAPSYFVQRPRTVLSAADLRWPRTADVETALARLSELWATDDPRLAALRDALRPLAETLRERSLAALFSGPASDDAELADMIYPMY
jgi:hypothetical protein